MIFGFVDHLSLANGRYSVTAGDPDVACRVDCLRTVLAAVPDFNSLPRVPPEPAADGKRFHAVFRVAYHSALLLIKWPLSSITELQLTER